MKNFLNVLKARIADGKLVETETKGYEHVASLLLSNLQLGRLVFALFSLITLHAMAIILNLPTNTWPLLDFTLLSSLTFTFGIVFVFAVFVFRLTSPILTFAASISVVVAANASSTRHRYPALQAGIKRALGSDVSELRAEAETDRTARLTSRLIEIVAWKVRKHGRVAFDAFSILAFFSVFCFFYVGFGWRVVVTAFILLVFYLFSDSVLLSRREKILLSNLLFGTLSERGNASIALVENRSSWNSVLLYVYLNLAVFSYATGYCRFLYLMNSDSVTISSSAFNGSAKYISANSAGILFRDENDGVVIYLSYDTGLSIRH